MKRIIQIITLLLITIPISAQNVTFFSPEFEEGIKRHLCIDENTPVIQLQTDTITDVDLSGLGIKDIRDVIYLPNVRTLDLSFNEISDVSPLLSLDSLHNVDLRNNMLEDVSELSFASSDSMIVNIAYNYITDFSRFYLPSNCNIRMIGMPVQKSKDVRYMDIYLLYADVENGQNVINYRGYSDSTESASLNCAGTHVNAVLDGNHNTVRIAENPIETSLAILSNGEYGDTTYVIPPTTLIADSGDEIAIDTKLPGSYRIGYLRALHGTVKEEGGILHYTAPSPIVTDTLYMSYYEGSRIRGFGQLYVMSQDLYNDIKTLQTDSLLKVSLHNGILNVTCTTSTGKGMTGVKVYDAMGRILTTQTPDNQQKISIQVPKTSHIVIVEITYAGQQFVKKVIAK